MKSELLTEGGYTREQSADSTEWIYDAEGEIMTLFKIKEIKSGKEFLVLGMDFENVLIKDLRNRLWRVPKENIFVSPAETESTGVFATKKRLPTYKFIGFVTDAELPKIGKKTKKKKKTKVR